MDKAYNGKFFEEYIEDSKKVYNMAMDALEFYNLHFPVEGMGYVFFTGFEDGFAKYHGEHAYNGCATDYYYEQLPIEFVWNPDFQLKYIADIKEKAKLAEEDAQRKAEETRKNSELTEEGKEKLEYLRLKKKYEGIL